MKNAPSFCVAVGAVYYLAMRGVAFDDKCGMVQSNIEQTIEAYGRLGREGMKQTDIEVLNIMLEK